MESTISKLKEWDFNVPAGWHNTFYEMIDKIESAFEDEASAKDFTFLDVKEKWGMLTVYEAMNGLGNIVPDNVSKIIREYEKRTQTICPICGKPKDKRDYMCGDCSNRYEEDFHTYVTVSQDFMNKLP